MLKESKNLKEGSGKELRHFHDTVQQHLRALKSMGHEPSGLFVTSLLELKLAKDTIFEWQTTSQDTADIPHYEKLLEFLDLRAQASESLTTEPKKQFSKRQNGKPVMFFVTNMSELATNCILCKGEKHPMYICPQFKSLPLDQMLATVHSITCA